MLILLILSFDQALQDLLQTDARTPRARSQVSDLPAGGNASWLFDQNRPKLIKKKKKEKGWWGKGRKKMLRLKRQRSAKPTHVNPTQPHSLGFSPNLIC